jgi:tetratricopeptide (TPR) repeat protein
MKRNHSKLWVAIVVLFLIQAGLQARIFPMWVRDYAPKQTAPVGLSPDQLLAAVAGFREFLAAILWVRADSFFDSGNYDAVLPMLRLVTWLDPHNLDVYSTGAWHMGYNFTDESQRSDRRFIPMALKFLEEGIQNNPAVWDLYFEMGWMYYHKIQDPVNAAPWMQIANEYPNMIPARRHMLAHTFFKAGRFDDAVDHWAKLLLDAEKGRGKDWESNNLYDVRQNNLEDTILDLLRRYGPNPETQPPIDLGFDATVKVVRPRVLLVEGRLGIPTIGARVTVILRDKGRTLEYSPKALKTFTFEVDSKLTYMQDSLAVREEKFRREIDMSKDPKMYPFKAEEYEVEFIFEPRYASPNIQARIGSDGVGMYDARYLEEVREKPAPIEVPEYAKVSDALRREVENPTRETTYKRVRKVITLTRADILMLGKRGE